MSTEELTSTETVDGSAERVFSTSMIISAVRCTLTYLVFPFVAPLLGVTSGVGPTLGLTIGLVAIVFNVLSIRRFWAAGHKYRKHITVLNLAVIGLLLVLMVDDVRTLLS